MWNLVSVYLETMLVSVQDSWTVRTKRNLPSEINMDAPDGLLGDEAQVEARYGPIGDGAKLDAR
jgi:hypothetical protein